MEAFVSAYRKSRNIGQSWVLPSPMCRCPWRRFHATFTLYFMSLTVLYIHEIKINFFSTFSQALVTNKSPPTHSPPAPPPSAGSSLAPQAAPPSSAPPSYATWERTSTGGGGGGGGQPGVPPPLSSAPPVGTTPPGGAGGSKAPPVKSMQQLQRQLSAGQSSIQSFSGKPQFDLIWFYRVSYLLGIG